MIGFGQIVVLWPRVVLLSLLAVAALPVASAVRVHRIADFASGSATDGWQIAANRWVSPSYSGEMVCVSATCSNAAPGSTLLVTALAGNAFEIAASGGAELARFDAEYVDRHLPVPSFSITNVVESSFLVTWDPVDGAVAYRICVCSNRLEGVESGTEVVSETFSHFPADSSTVALADATFKTLSDLQLDWECQRVYYCDDAIGMVRIGNTSDFGSLAMPVPEVALGCEGMSLRLVVRQKSGSGGSLPVDLVSSSSVTQRIGSVAVGTEMAAVDLALPVLSAGDRLIVNSITNSKSATCIILDGLALVRGWDPGRVVPECYSSVTVTGATAWAASGFPAVASEVTVQALEADSSYDSPVSEPVALPLDDPPPMPVLRALGLEAFEDGGYGEDFERLAVVTKRQNWYNCVNPLPYWMAVLGGGEAVASIGKASSNSSTYRVYSFSSTNESAEALSGCVLGIQAQSASDICCGIAFTNDSTRTYGDFSLSYLAVQWGFKNRDDDVQTLACEWLVTNGLADVSAPGDWQPVGDLSFSTGDAAADRGDCRTLAKGPAALGCKSLPPGMNLLVRFRAEGGTNRAGFGVDDFHLSFTARQNGLCVIVR